MKAHISDNFDLVLRWEDDVRCEVVWSPCSECEFEVTAKLWFPPFFHYQGPTRIDFSTTCYAYALRFFADELDAFASGKKTSAEYHGSEDMSITLRERSGQADFAEKTVAVCDLKYEMMTEVDMVTCDAVIELTLGKPVDAAGTAKAIREVLASLKMDDSLEAPRTQ
jgi:hypothetical protein